MKKIIISRFYKNISFKKEYISKKNNLLQVLIDIKKHQDPSLAFRCGCKSGVCGSCAVKVNGVEKLACKTNIKDDDLIEALNNANIIKDLVVSLAKQKEYLKKSKSFLEKLSTEIITKKDENLIDLNSKCILCQICHSSCPVYEVNENFLGPYALSRVLRYVEDKKEADISSKLETIQNDGIWDCTLCGNCTIVCPQFIDPKNDILKLRMKSVQNGYEDKTYSQSSSFDSGFDSGFDPMGGFNPNF